MKPQNPGAVSDVRTVLNSFYKVLRANVSFGSPDTYAADTLPATFIQDNTDGILIRVGSNANPESLANFWSGSNTDTTITHNLGRLPIGYIVTRKSKTCDVYDGTIASTAQEITLKNTDGTADTVVYIF